MIAKTLTGLEGVLEKELTALGAQQVKALRRAVEFYGDKEVMYRANLWSRLSVSILKPVFEFDFTTQDDFYNRLREFAWDELFEVNKTMAITAVSNSNIFNNTQFVAQRAKDAIADYFREKTGQRPSVDLNDPHIRFNIFINQEHCVVSFDSSGIPLFKRGYRKGQGDAPISEVLAAGLIALSGWDKKQAFYDPMCGSATFSIEAAMLAYDMAPANFRNSFAFQHTLDYEPDLWNRLKEEARSRVKSQGPEIIASDINHKNMAVARQNIMEAGLLGRIRLEKRDFFTSNPRHRSGVVFLNPPYGIRIQTQEIDTFWSNLGSTLKHRFIGFQAWVISPDKNLTHKIALRTSVRYNVYNGQLDCQFAGYNLYDGSKKIHKEGKERSPRPRL